METVGRSQVVLFRWTKRSSICRVLFLHGLSCLPQLNLLGDPVEPQHAPPTAKQLMKRIRLLSPTNESLQSFRATVSMPNVYAGFSAEIAWSRNGDALMRATTGPEGVPCWFVSQNQGFVFDASGNRVTLLKNAKPKILLSAMSKTIEFKVGIGGQKTADLIKIDLPSFIESSVDHEVSRTADGQWLLTARSKSGRAKVIATFSPTETAKLRHLIIRPVDSDQPVLLEVRDIAIDEKSIPFTPFPNVDSFPKTVELVKSTDNKSLGLSEAFGEMQHFLRVAICQLAITNEEMRSLEKFPLNIDWDRAKENYYGVGCELRDLIRAPVTDQNNQLQGIAE